MYVYVVRIHILYTMWYERVCRWYENEWYEKKLVRNTRLHGMPYGKNRIQMSIRNPTLEIASLKYARRTTIYRKQ